mmetsp:Transcript_17201/g.32282  ORF Transcript_17201/g.32282 Transcript_17201/m.32282 type:complete len:418 (-) Transcript_17201:407-1660(-)
MNLLRTLFPSQHVLHNLKSIHSCLPISFQRRRNWLKIFPILRQPLQRIRHHALVCLERLSQSLPVELELGHLHLPRLVQLERCLHGRLRRLPVYEQIVASPVGVSHALNPSIRALDLQIPAVAGVVRHFGGQVLAKAEAGGVHSDLLHEELRSSHEIGEGFVVDQSDGYGLSDGDCFGFARAELIDATKENEFLGRDGGEVGVGFVVGVDEVFDFAHAEFSDAEEAGARGNFVPKSETNLSGRKRHFLRISIQQPPEINKQSLRRLGPQKSNRRTLRTDARLEHEIEWKRRTIRLVVRRLTSVFHQLLVQLRGRKRVRLYLNPQMPLLLHRGHIRILLDQFVNGVLQQFVRPEALPAHRILHHKISESIYVSRSFEYRLGSEAGAFHLEHGFREDKVFPPCVHHGSLDGAGGRAEVE